MTSTPPIDPDRSASTAVVVLGWKPTEVLQSLSTFGAHVVCVCEPPDSAAAQASGLAREVVVAPSVADAAEVFAALVRARIALTPDTMVCSADEFPLVTASTVGQALGCRAWPVPLALALRDKFVQKELIRAAGIPVAQAHHVDYLSDLDQVPFDGPYVVKPFDEAGVRRTALVRDTEQALLFARRSGAQDLGPWLVESFVTGSELHVDGVVRAGEPQLVGVSRYLNNVMDFRNGGLVGSTLLDPSEFPELYGRVTETTTRALVALGHRDGVFHLELFEQESALVFGECAGRVGGGRVDTVCQLKFGVDLHEEWARAVLDLPSVTAEAKRDERSFGWLHLPAVAGRVTAMPSAQEIRDRPGLEVVEMKVGVGDVMANTGKNSNARAGRAVVSGRDAAEVEQRLRALADWFRARVQVEPTQN
jgi:biotin carboxylase